MNVGTGKLLDSVMHGWGQDFDNKIEYLEVIKPSLLSYKHFGESEDYNFTVFILFEEVEGKTLLTMKSVFKSKAIIEELNKRVKAIEGAKQTLDRLENYIKILASNKPINNPKKIENMRKIISFMHMSLDGFVAGPNGEMNWIKLGEEIFDHVGKRIGDTDTALYGRVTYRMMENYWPTAGDKPDASRHDMEHSKWYNKAHKIVLSKTMKDAGLTDTTIISDNVSDKINEIKQQAGGEILLFGSPTATHSLIQHNLIDGYWLFVNPIILGQGIPLFTDIKDKIKLNLLTTRQFTCGVTELNYTVERQ